MIAPTNTIHIATVPWDSSYSEVMYFENETARDSYLTSVTSYTDTNCTFIRKEEAVNVAVRYNDVLRSNYVWFYNSDFLGSQGQKFVGCFIDRIEYVSPERTKLYLKEDVWTTWVFLIDDWSDCYVKRQHISKSDDIIGNYRLCDNFDCSPMVVSSESTIDILNDKKIVLMCLMPQVEISGTVLEREYATFCNVPTPSFFLVFDVTSDGLTLFSQVMDYLSKNDGVPLAAYPFPTAIIEKMGQGEISIAWNSITLTVTYLFEVVMGNIPIINYGFRSVYGTDLDSITRPDNLDGYTPRNNIMYCDPYIYLEVVAGNGNKRSYRFEDLETPADFVLYYPILPGSAPFVYPTMYNGTVGTTSETMQRSVSKYSVCGNPTPNGALSQDAFNEWMSQNGGKMTASLLNSVSNATLSASSSVLSQNIMGVAGAVMQPAISYVNYLGTLRDAKNLNDSYFGLNSPNSFEPALCNNFCFTTYTLRERDARRIDNFYSRYGYLIEDVTSLNISSRTIFNYIETRGIHISGNLPDYARLQIAQAFDRGITIWHTTNNFGEYNDTIFANNT